MISSITPPRPEELLAPLLASLPAASISPSPPTALLPLLSPILRQRVQLLSASIEEPWLPLLCYDSAKAKELEKSVRNDRFEPHPVSGEVEIDWETEVKIRYKRVDKETLQALVTLQDLGLDIRLVWCVNDIEGGGDGWRIGEVGVLDPTTTSWGQQTIPLAEEAFVTQNHTHLISHNRANGTNPLLTPDVEEEDDDDYWAQYDNTPARTPATKRSPAPPASTLDFQAHADNIDEDSYYAQYSTVQPAMDNHDPDEAAQNGNVESSLGHEEITQAQHPPHSLSPSSEQKIEIQNSSLAWTLDGPPLKADSEYELAHPRPASSSSSSGSLTVAKLERKAELSSRELSEVGIRQHIATSVKSLYRLARVAGIERSEFERIVHTEVECLGLWDEDEHNE